MLTPRYYPYLAVLLIFSVYGLVWFRSFPHKFQAVTVLFITVFISEVSTRILGYTIKSTNPAYHFLIPLMAVQFSFMYKNLSHRNYTIVVGGIVAVSSILLSVLHDPILSFPSLAFVLLAIFTVSLSLFDFIRLLRLPVEQSIFETPEFWLNTGNIFFYSLTFFVFGLNNIGIDVLPFWIYDLIFFANIVLYTVYGWSLVLASRHSNEKGRHFTN